MQNKIFDTEIRFKLDSDLRRAINAAAGQRRQSASELARSLLRDGLQRMTGQGGSQPPLQAV